MNGILLLHFTAILVLGFYTLSEAKTTDYGKMNSILLLHVMAILAHGFCPLSGAKTTDYGKMNSILLLHVTAILAHGLCTLSEAKTTDNDNVFFTDMSYMRWYISAVPHEMVCNRCAT